MDRRYHRVRSRSHGGSWTTLEIFLYSEWENAWRVRANAPDQHDQGALPAVGRSCTRAFWFKTSMGTARRDPLPLWSSATRNPSWTAHSCAGGSSTQCDGVERCAVARRPRDHAQRGASHRWSFGATCLVMMSPTPETSKRDFNLV